VVNHHWFVPKGWFLGSGSFHAAWKLTFLICSLHHDKALLDSRWMMNFQLHIVTSFVGSSQTHWMWSKGWFLDCIDPTIFALKRLPTAIVRKDSELLA
jgi:hypothetical protein